jgi:hypothetical protein
VHHPGAGYLDGDLGQVGIGPGGENPAAAALVWTVGNRSEKIPNARFGTRNYYRKTALFERLLKFDVKMEFSEGPRH